MKTRRILVIAMAMAVAFSSMRSRLHALQDPGQADTVQEYAQRELDSRDLEDFRGGDDEGDTMGFFLGVLSLLTGAIILVGHLLYLCHDAVFGSPEPETPKP